MANYIIIDTHNLFYRILHVVSGSDEEKTSTLLRIMNISIARIYNAFSGTHLVFAADSRNKNNWRRQIDPAYKANRVSDTKNQFLFEALDDYIEYLTNATNCTVLRSHSTEADDLISRWIFLHPDDKHVIVSNDKDFDQLIAANVIRYNGAGKKTVFCLPNTEIPDSIGGMIGAVNEIDDPEYVLFEKIIRGDKNDNVFSALPGIRKKPTKSGKPSILGVYADRHNKGMEWNNFMNMEWVDHNNNICVVKNCFDRNRILVDLSAQPEHIKQEMDEHIIERVSKQPKKAIVRNLCRFLHKYDIDQPDKIEEIATMFAVKYAR